MALFERITAEGYSVAKATINPGEPSGLQVEIFLRNLKYYKLRYTEPGDLPTITKEVVVEKKFKYEKKHIEVVQIKNIHGQAKMLSQEQKSENQKLRREKEAKEKGKRKNIKDN